MRPESKYLQHILDTHRDDIARFQPDLDWQPGRAGQPRVRGREGRRDRRRGAAAVRGRHRPRPARLRHAEVPRLLPRRVRVAAQRGAARARLPPGGDVAGHGRPVLPTARVRPVRGPLRARARRLRPRRRRPSARASSRAAPESIASVACAMPAVSASCTRGSRRVVDGQRRSRVEEYGVPHRAGLPGQQPAYDVGVVLDVAAAQRVAGAERDAERRGVDRRRRHLALVGHPHRRGAGGRELVEPVVAAEHPGVDAAARRTRPPSPAPSGCRRSRSPARRAWAGLASGPRKLNVVPMPSSRRGTAACRRAGWKAAAKQNVMPASSATAATRSAGRSSRMPSASSTSAEPAFERRGHGCRA